MLAGVAAAAAVWTLPLRRRPGQPLRRRLSDVDAARLFGNLEEHMIYFVDALVGTPAQHQSLIVDTGSAITAFPCTHTCGSSGCGSHLDPPFDPSQSATFREVTCSSENNRCESSGWARCSGLQCQYAVTYLGDSSIQGVFMEDMLQLGHVKLPNSRALVWLGCHQLETGTLRTQVPSGIMGLKQEGWDVITALAGGDPLRQEFALCLSDNGGALSFGGLNSTWMPQRGTMQWAYMRGHYVEARGADVVGPDGALDTALTFGTVLVDSGTTFTYFDGQAQALRSKIAEVCLSHGFCRSAQPHSTACWTVDEKDVTTFPTLRFRLRGVDGGEVAYDWLPEGYLYRPRGSAATKWCYAFGDAPPVTFGASFLKHHVAVFDREPERFGFVASDCLEVGSRADPMPDFADLSGRATVTSVDSSGETNGSESNTELQGSGGRLGPRTSSDSLSWSGRSQICVVFLIVHRLFV